MLTQVTIMDLVVQLMESENGVALINESGFIKKLFEQHAGDQTFVRSNMLLVGAKLFSMDRFEAFDSPNYMEMLRFFVCAPIDNDKPHLKDIGLNAMIFLFMRRDKLIPGFIERVENHDLINALLRVSKTTIQEHRKSFLLAIRQLLKIGPAAELSVRENDVLKMIVSNIMTPERFPNTFGQLPDSISFLVQLADTPYDQEELLCLRIFKQLVKHEWGCKALFTNEKAIGYVVYRTKSSATESIKRVAEKNYSLIERVIKSPYASSLDAVVMTQLQSYHSQGLWGNDNEMT